MRTWQRVLGAMTASFAAATVVSCGGGGSTSMGTNPPTSGFVATHLVSNTNTSTNPYSSSNVDPNLVNAWGIAFNPQGFVWVANNGTSTSTLYDGNGVPQSLIVSIPPGSAGRARPTGIAFNGAAAFNVSQGGVSGASAFIFVGEAGTVSGWSPGVNTNSAILVVDGAAQGKVYKGLALSTVAGAPRLYATDFHNGAVDVLDTTVAPVVVAGAFTDSSLPAGYSPFGIQAIGNRIFVTFAMKNPASNAEVVGPGLGAVDIFDPSGSLVTRLVAPGGSLNAPWGLAVAPANFGPSSNALLVGNFGDGTINAFNATTGASMGPLTESGAPLAISGLWGLAFGNGINVQPTNTLFYTAGPAGGNNGVYGRIDFH